MGPGSYGLFSTVNPAKFKRVLSNLINNAVEATESNGKVDVVVSSRESWCVIQVRDNGKGIPPEILRKLGERGASYGKADGSGLGIFHAHEIINSEGGNLTITSVVNQGTTVTIELPRADPPKWFVPELRLEAANRLVILDDDASIHQVWQNRLKTVRGGVEIHNFSEAKQLEAFHRSNSSDLNVIYLLDYELLGQAVTGMDLIRKLGIQKQAILVSSRFEESQLVQNCEEIGVRIIPKSLASQIPIYSA